MGQREKACKSLCEALRMALQPGFERALGVVLNTAGLYLAASDADQAQRIWHAVSSNKFAYHEDRQEAAGLIGNAADAPVASITESAATLSTDLLAFARNLLAQFPHENIC